MKRPTEVTVFGVLNIVFGSLGLACAPFSLLLTLNPEILPARPGPDPMAEIMAQSPALRNWTIGSTLVGMAASTVLLIAGIGLLNMKSWGRTLSICFGIYGIISSLLALVINYFLLLVPLMEKGKDQAEAMAGAMGGTIGGVIGGCAALVYPILLLCFMLTAKVSRSFKPVISPYPDLSQDYSHREDRFKE